MSPNALGVWKHIKLRKKSQKTASQGRDYILILLARRSRLVYLNVFSFIKPIKAVTKCGHILQLSDRKSESSAGKIFPADRKSGRPGRIIESGSAELA